VLVLGDGAQHAAALAAAGADRVLVAEGAGLVPYTTDAHAATLAEAIRARAPRLVLVPSSARGRDLAPRVAARPGLRLTGDAAGAALEAADVVLGVGRGIGGPAALPAITALAVRLGAAVAATREVTDLGWLPKQHQVGLTGRAIAPRLYVALALSGAPEHVVGLRRAGVIVAINKNPKAPIFKAADLGLVSDYAPLLPLLEAALRPS